jgi:nucleoside-diphosphate-sugar epimerase
MINPKILVTDATGRTGGAVVTQLLAKGYPVRANVRVQDARSDLLQQRGAEVVLDTGNDAEDFETIARRHAVLPASRQSFGAQLAALARFLAVPMLPAFNPAIYDRAQEQPVPPTPHLASRRRRVDGQPPCPWVSYGGQYAEGK